MLDNTPQQEQPVTPPAIIDNTILFKEFSFPATLPATNWCSTVSYNPTLIRNVVLDLAMIPELPMTQICINNGTTLRDVYTWALLDKCIFDSLNAARRVRASNTIDYVDHKAATIETEIKVTLTLRIEQLIDVSITRSIYSVVY